MRSWYLTQEAECEFKAAVRWYTRSGIGLSQRFRVAVRHALRRIAADPEFWPIECRDIRRAILVDWPFSIIFRSHPATIEIISIFHHKRDPQEWMDRT